MLSRSAALKILSFMEQHPNCQVVSGIVTSKEAGKEFELWGAINDGAIYVPGWKNVLKKIPDAVWKPAPTQQHEVLSKIRKEALLSI